jgi:hypothetical protein
MEWDSPPINDASKRKSVTEGDGIGTYYQHGEDGFLIFGSG